MFYLCKNACTFLGYSDSYTVLMKVVTYFLHLSPSQPYWLHQVIVFYVLRLEFIYDTAFDVGFFSTVFFFILHHLTCFCQLKLYYLFNPSFRRKSVSISSVYNLIQRCRKWCCKFCIKFSCILISKHFFLYFFTFEPL